MFLFSCEGHAILNNMGVRPQPRHWNSLTKTMSTLAEYYLVTKGAEPWMVIPIGQDQKTEYRNGILVRTNFLVFLCWQICLGNVEVEKPSGWKISKVCDLPGRKTHLGFTTILVEKHESCVCEAWITMYRTITIRKSCGWSEHWRLTSHRKIPLKLRVLVLRELALENWSKWAEISGDPIKGFEAMLQNLKASSNQEYWGCVVIW